MELLPSDVETQTFRVAKKGYDRDEVGDFLKKVGRQMSALEERAKIAAVRADQLERKTRELEQSQSNVADAYRDALETRKRLIREAEEEAGRIRTSDDGAPPAVSLEHAELEAQRIVAQAKLEAERTHTAAETVLQRALAASDRIETETQRILDEARIEAEAIRNEARVEMDEMRSRAALLADEERSSLEVEQRDLIRRVRALQAEIAALEAQRPAPHVAVEEPHDHGALPEGTAEDAPAAPPEHVPGGPLVEPVFAEAAAPEDVVDDVRDEEPEAAEVEEVLDDVRDDETEAAEVEEVLVDVRDEESIAVDIAEPGAAETAEPARKQSRYMSRSAKLPHIGDDAGSVLGSMEALRKKAE